MKSLAEISAITTEKTGFEEELVLSLRSAGLSSERVVTVYLTKKGEVLHAKTKPRMIGAVEHYFAEKLNPSEHRTLNRLMIKLSS